MKGEGEIEQKMRITIFQRKCKEIQMRNCKGVRIQSIYLFLSCKTTKITKNRNKLVKKIYKRNIVHM